MLVLALMIFVGIYRTVWWEIAAIAACVSAISTMMGVFTGITLTGVLTQYAISFLIALAVGYSARLATWLIAGSSNAPGRTGRVSGFFGERRKK